MGCHYSTRDFFRQMPSQLLVRYFAARGVLAGVYLAALAETQIEPLFAAWLELARERRKASWRDRKSAALRSTKLDHALSPLGNGFCIPQDRASICNLETFRFLAED
ncbi:MAG: hypothetical protein ACLGQX_05625 [Acidobacteriota bacterium]